MKKTYFPPAFREKYAALLGQEWDAFFAAISSKIPKTIWMNSLKADPARIRQRLESRGWFFAALPFHENALELLTSGVKLSDLPEWKEGLLNAQEKAAMLPAIVLNPAPGEKVLDACAAPGNKTLQLSCLMQGEGEIAAVEKNSRRFAYLKHYMQKFGLRNVTAYRADFLAFSHAPFDKILLDAPCSSEGWVRKKRDALLHWSTALVAEKAVLQKKLIQKAFALLAPNGTIVYSTCSFSMEENEGVVAHLLEKNASAELLPVEIKGVKIRPGLLLPGSNKRLEKCARLYPQDNNTEQFFMARIRKKE